MTGPGIQALKVLVGGVVVLVAVAALFGVLRGGSPSGPKVSGSELEGTVGAAYLNAATADDASMRVKSVNCSRDDGSSNRQWTCKAGIGVLGPDGTVRYRVSVAQNRCWVAQAPSEANVVDSFLAFGRDRLEGCLGGATADTGGSGSARPKEYTSDQAARDKAIDRRRTQATAARDAAARAQAEDYVAVLARIGASGQFDRFRRLEVHFADGVHVTDSMVKATCRAVASVRSDARAVIYSSPDEYDLSVVVDTCGALKTPGQ